MFVTYQYVKKTLRLLHSLLDVAILCLLRYEHKILSGSLIIVIVLECFIYSLTTLYFVVYLLLVIVLTCISEYLTTGVGILRG